MLLIAVTAAVFIDLLEVGSSIVTVSLNKLLRRSMLLPHLFLCRHLKRGFVSHNAKIRHAVHRLLPCHRIWIPLDPRHGVIVYHIALSRHDLEMSVPLVKH